MVGAVFKSLGSSIYLLFQIYSISQPYKYIQACNCQWLQARNQIQVFGSQMQLVNQFRLLIFRMGTSMSQKAISTKGQAQGKQTKTQQIQISIGFLDYGVCASPFQYFTQEKDGTDSKQMTDLQTIFTKQFKIVCNIEWTQDFNWQVGELDKKTRKGRYSALYQDNVGIIDNKFFANQQDFKRIWNETFDTCVKKSKDIGEINKNHRDNLLNMDFIHYRTFVVYTNREGDQSMAFDKIILEKSINKYRDFMRQKFRCSLIDEKNKIDKLLRRLNKLKLDVFFIQDIDPFILKAIYKKTNYRIVDCSFGKSAILISWDGIRKMVEDEFKTLNYYNQKHFDPNQQYKRKPIEKKQEEPAHFGENEERKFEYDGVNTKKIINRGVKLLQPISSPKKPAPEAEATNDVQMRYEQQNQPQTTTTALKLTRKTLATIKQYLTLQLFNKLMWNQTTIVQFLDQVILITCSFSEHQKTAEKEYELMRESLFELNLRYDGMAILVAINIEKELLFRQNLYPFKILPGPESDVPTTCKKLTLLQSRLKLRNKQLKGQTKKHGATEDFILTNRTIKNIKIIDIDENTITVNTTKYLPNEAHPYDHYLVTGTFKYEVPNKTTQKI